MICHTLFILSKITTFTNYFHCIVTNICCGWPFWWNQSEPVFIKCSSLVHKPLFTILSRGFSLSLSLCLSVSLSLSLQLDVIIVGSKVRGVSLRGRPKTGWRDGVKRELKERMSVNQERMIVLDRSDLWRSLDDSWRRFSRIWWNPWIILGAGKERAWVKYEAAGINLPTLLWIRPLPLAPFAWLSLCLGAKWEECICMCAWVSVCLPFLD